MPMPKSRMVLIVRSKPARSLYVMFSSDEITALSSASAAILPAASSGCASRVTSAVEPSASAGSAGGSEESADSTGSPAASEEASADTAGASSCTGAASEAASGVGAASASGFGSAKGAAGLACRLAADAEGSVRCSTFIRRAGPPSPRKSWEIMSVISCSSSRESPNSSSFSSAMLCSWPAHTASSLGSIRGSSFSKMYSASERSLSLTASTHALRSAKAASASAPPFSRVPFS